LDTTSATNLSKAATLTTPLISTHRRATEKVSKYKEIASVNNYELIPFIIETYGGIGKAATALLKRMSVHSREYSSKEFLIHAYSRLSVCLQSSNANLILLSMQQLATSFHLTKKQMHKTRYSYSQPVSSNVLHVQLEKQMNGLEATYERRVALSYGDSAAPAPVFPSSPAAAGPSSRAPSPAPSSFSSSAPDHEEETLACDDFSLSTSSDFSSSFFHSSCSSSARSVSAAGVSRQFDHSSRMYQGDYIC